MKKLVLLSLAALPLFAAAQVPSYVPANGLVGWWPFNGNANDESGNGNNGTVNGATPTTDRNGNVNAAYSFDGVNDFIQTPNQTLTASVSFSGWYNMSNFNTPGNDMFFVSNQSPLASIYSANIAFGFRSYQGDYGHSTYVQSPLTGYYATNNLPATNVWHHIVCVFENGSYVKMYLDSVLVYSNSSVVTNLSTANLPLLFGGTGSSSFYYYFGKLDDIGIWNRALTPCEIQALYNAGSGGTALTSSVSSVCAGSAVTLTASGASTYSWQPGNLVGSSVTLTPGATTTYTVTGTDANGCVSSDTLTLPVNNLPVVTASATSGNICFATSDTLTASGALTYAWSTGGTAQSEVVMPSVTTSYTVSGTDINGCSNVDTVVVNVNALPQVFINASSTVLCAGVADTLTASGAASYLWSTGGSLAVEIVAPTASTLYVVTGTDSNGCINSDTVQILVNALPQISVASASTIYCEADASGALVGLPSQGIWSGPGVSGSAFNPSVAGAGTHNAIYTYTDNNGCSNSDTLVMTVDLCTGITENTSSTFTVYPNPANNNITVSWSTADIKTLTLRDAAGRVVRTYNVNGTHAQLSLEGLASGVYFLSVGNCITCVQKIVKQ